MPQNKISAQRFGAFMFANETVALSVGRAPSGCSADACPLGSNPAFRFRRAGNQNVFGHEPIPSNNSAAVTPSTASLVRLTEADSLRQKTAVELQRYRGNFDDFDTHCDSSEQLLAQLKSRGWCLEGADHLTLHWRRCQAEAEVISRS